MRRDLGATPLVVLSLLLAGCGGIHDEPRYPLGKHFPRFESTDIDGNPVLADQFEGTVLVVAWLENTTRSWDQPADAAAAELRNASIAIRSHDVPFHLLLLGADSDLLRWLASDPAWVVVADRDLANRFQLGRGSGDTVQVFDRHGNMCFGTDEVHARTIDVTVRDLHQRFDNVACR